MAAIGMPPHILALFAARKPLDPFPAFKSKHPRRYIGLSDYVKKFEVTPPPAPIPFESPRQRKQRIKRTKLLQHLQQQQQLVELYKPLQDKNIQGDPFCTLFIGKLSYDTTEKKLKREFEVYGQIKRIKIITNKEGKSRGYAFIEYFNDKDMKEAYKKGDGTKIDNKRILVDVERARTVPGWLPRRLGGGRGPPRGAGKNQPDLSTLVAQINNPNNNNNNINKEKEKEKERDREREKERDRDRDRDRDRERERERDRDRDRHRDRDRGGDRGDRRRRSRSRSREKRRDDRDRDRRR